MKRQEIALNIVMDDVPLSEKSLIEQIRSMSASASRRSKSIVTGIGDDCAVLRISGQRQDKQDTVVTTDLFLEGIHFRRDWHSPESAGHRCLTRGLSDIAAMGGEPGAAFLSLAFPRSLPHSWINGFLHGLLTLAKKQNVTLAGGDTAESPNGILADIVVVGSVPQGQAILRSGARPGDLIYVTGALGASAAAVNEMIIKPARKLNPKHYNRHFFPEARIEIGRILREKKVASAMIDISDGLSTDLAHICEESGVGAVIKEKSIPCDLVGKLRWKVAIELALHGGEDYELLFTAPAGKRLPSRIAGVLITQIGRITRSKKILLTNETGAESVLEPGGWEHFAPPPGTSKSSNPAARAKSVIRSSKKKN